MNVFNYLINLIFPPRCVACRKPSFNEKFETVCDSCLKSIPIHNGLRCSECNRHLTKPKLPCHSKKGFIIAGAADYKNQVVRELIHALKYKNIKKAAEPLAYIINLYLIKSGLKDKSAQSDKKRQKAICIPLPISLERQKERGFNQSSLLASLVLENNPIKKEVLLKNKNTKPQIECESYVERAINTSGSFVVIKPEEVKGKNIILVDDVYTSGATAREAVKILKMAGVKKVMVLVVARAGN